MLPVLQLGGAAVPLPPLILLATLYIALDLSQRQAVKLGLDGGKVYNLGFNSLIVALLTSRIAFIVLHFNSYLDIEPTGRMIVAMITPLLGSESPLIGMALGTLTVAFYIRRYKFQVTDVTDSYAIGAAIFVVGLWLANFASGDSYGIQTGLPWGINLWGAKRHPTQIYNLIVSIGILLFLRRIQPAPLPHLKKKKKKKARKTSSGRLRVTAPYKGYVTQMFVLLTGLTILVLEPLRDDSLVVFDNVRAWQIGALVALIISLAIFAWKAPALSTRSSEA